MTSKPRTRRVAGTIRPIARVVDGRASTNHPSRLVRASTFVIGSVFAAVLGFVGGSLSPLGTKLAIAVLDPGVIADRVRTSIPIDASSQIVGHLGSRGTYAFSEPLDLNASEQQLLQSDPCGTPEACDSFESLVQKRNGVLISPLQVNLTLRGMWDQVVRITSIRVEFTLKEGPLTGGVLCSGTEGASDIDAVVVDLDQSQPVFELVSVDSGEVVGPYVARRNLTLQRNEIITINVTFKTQAHFAAFKVALDYTAGTTKGTVYADDSGIPFQVTAPASPDSFTSYHLSGYRTGWARNESIDPAFHKVLPGDVLTDCGVFVPDVP